MANPDGQVPTIKPGTSTIDNNKNLTDLIGPIVQSVLTYIYWAIGIAALLYLVWAGYKYITSGGDTKKAGEARIAILNAVIGIAIVVAAYAITQFGFSLGKTVNDAVGGTAAGAPVVPK